MRFYCLIPMMGQTTASKMALWRAYCTTSADMVFDDGFDVGALCEKLREFLNPERAGRENVPVRPGLRPWNDNE